jgi:hypothetical protein
MRQHVTWLVLLGLFLILWIAACSSGSSGGNPTPPPTPSVTVTPSTLTISTGGTAQFSATINGTTTDQLVSWEVAGTVGGDSVHGLISPDGVYVAPTSVPNPSTVTITAVSFDDASKTGTAKVTIQSGSGVHVVIAGSSAPVTVAAFGSYLFSATVTGTTNIAVTWQVNGVAGGSALTGTVTSSGLYYAPHSVPVSINPNNDGQTTAVIVTAVSQADSTASDSVLVFPTAAQGGHFTLPIPLGVSGGNAADSSTAGSVTYCCSGTLGSLISRGGNLYILSCNHVLARSDLASIGDSIIQPGLVSNNCSVTGTNTVANLSQFFNLETGPLPNVDAAMAEIVPGGVDPLGTILQLGGMASGGQPTNGTPNPGPGVAPTIGGAVAKSGSATGLTCSTILAINTDVSIEYQKGCNSSTTFDVEFVNQVDITGEGFSAAGDSGSLVVTQDTADPVGLLYGGSDTDTVANPVADVLEQLADPSTGEKPVFVGDPSVGPHPVAACTIAQAQSVAALSLTAAESAAFSNQLEAATSTRDAHAAALMAYPGVQALGVGASYDNPGEPAILVFRSRGLPPRDIPAQLDGIRTRIIEGDSFAKSGVLSPADSAALEQAAAPKIVYPVSDDEVARARVVHAGWSAKLMARRGIQGVGISSSLDSPGEAALIIFVVRGVSRDPIPAVIDGVRTRIRETSRFRAR